MSTWNYKAQVASTRHIGPMAQDFAKAFKVGEDERRISTVDADGVALARDLINTPANDLGPAELETAARALAKRPEDRFGSAEEFKQALIDGAGIATLWADVWPLIVMGILLIPAGIWSFGRAERYAKRTGKLKRVG